MSDKAKPLRAGKACRECGRPLAGLGLKPSAVFCCAEHRKAWNNRRMIRGAEMYDLMMGIRYERELAGTKNLMTVISNLARAYRDADKATRDGRQSWNVHETLARLPIAFGEDGDKR